MNLDLKDYEKTYTSKLELSYKLFRKFLRLYVEDGNTVVDIGAGVGIGCKLIHECKENCEVIGIEKDKESIQISKKIPNYSPILAKVENMPIRNGVADVVTSNHMMHWVSDKEKVIDEVTRILKRKGRSLIGDSCYLDGVTPEEIAHYMNLTRKNIGHAHRAEDFIKLGDLNNLLEEYSMTILKFEEVIPNPNIKRKYYVTSARIDKK
jgi:ubiquinone/menaquinone biosynthesis C-methylase UbiE